jgi:hypothetical protein
MSNTVLTNGQPVPEDRSHEQIDPRTGMQRGYVVLSEEERKRGFVKPVRQRYKHVGPPQPVNLRDLTEEEIQHNDPKGGLGYVKYEEYGPEQSPLVGKFWTQAELDRVQFRCGAVTTMGLALAETYARNPSFYGGTFCAACRKHYPLVEFTWEPDGEPMEVSMQEEWHKHAAEHVQQKIAEQNAQLRATWERRRQELRDQLARLEAEEPK